MATVRRKGEESAKTRTAILDATETIMLEEGYAAVSSRRVAAVAGLKSQLVYYHFGAMDALFLAVLERSTEQFYKRHLQALTAADPLKAFWELSIDARTRLFQEFMALASHNKAVRAALARAAEKTRETEVVLMGRILDGLGVDQTALPPIVLSVLIAGASRALVTEATLGVTMGHDETRRFIERALAQLAAGRSGVTA
jgi:AcrR family transcriptional regulator